MQEWPPPASAAQMHLCSLWSMAEPWMRERRAQRLLRGVPPWGQGGAVTVSGNREYLRITFLQEPNLSEASMFTVCWTLSKAMRFLEAQSARSRVETEELYILAWRAHRLPFNRLSGSAKVQSTIYRPESSVSLKESRTLTTASTHPLRSVTLSSNQEQHPKATRETSSLG